MLSRRSVLGSFAPAVLGARRGGRRPKPNLLFLISDDHAGYVLGADGDRRALTPNLDRLASEGVRFAAHYCNSPVCTPSRQSFFTSLLPHAAGVTVLRTPLAEDQPTLARQLNAAGYHTAVFGKMHFNRPSQPGLHGFRTLMLEGDIQKAWQAAGARRPVPAGIPTKKLPWQPFRDPARVWLNAGKLPYPRYYEEMRGTFTARRACQFLRQHKDDTFALWASFPDPHSPFDFPVEERDRFDARSFPVPQVGVEDAWQIPLIFRDLSFEEKQGIISAYYTSVHHLDRNIGEVLDTLRELGLEDDTLVVYLSDHGYCLGHHGRFEKHCGFDPALRVPLIVRFPGRVRRSAVVRDFTESVDVPPTILDLLGVDRFAVNHGHSLRPYLEGRRPLRPRDHIFSEYLENEEAFLRTERWKFVFCSGKRERTDGYKTDHPTPGRYLRLYDLRQDPGEFSNVAPQHPAVVARLRSLLLERFRTTHPEAPQEPGGLAAEDALEWYLRPRDAVQSML